MTGVQTCALPISKGVTGSYVVRGDIAGSGTFTLAAGDSLAFDAVFQAYPGGGEPLHPDVAAEFAARKAFVRECIDANLVLETPDPVIDTQFRYAKLRAAESIVATKGGYMHAPGGESYYAAIWANDQAEYARELISAYNAALPLPGDEPESFPGTLVC